MSTEKLRSITKNLDLVNCVTEEGNMSTDQKHMLFESDN
jgi:hypothetical protein